MIRGTLVIVILVAIEAGQRLVELRAIRIVLNSAFQKIFPELEIFALGLDPEGKARLAENFDTFLTLLTSQLKNQDPLSPMDANEFTGQIVQMTGVEQQLLTNDLLQKLVSNTAGGLDTALGLIGKQVRAVTTDAALTNGKAEWVYKLDSDAADVKVEVLDARGQVVSATALADVKAGDHDFTWNGKNALGQTLPDGTYTLRVSAKSAMAPRTTIPFLVPPLKLLMHFPLSYLNAASEKIVLFLREGYSHGAPNQTGRRGSSPP